MMQENSPAPPVTAQGTAAESFSFLVYKRRIRWHLLIHSLSYLLIYLLSESDSHSVVSNSLQSHGLLPARLLCPWDSPGKNTGVRSHSLLQGIFPSQGSNPGLLHCMQILYPMSHQGNPISEHLQMLTHFVNIKPLLPP